MESEPTVVYLGNRDAFETYTDPDTGETEQRPIGGKRCTTINVPAGTSLLDAAREITHPQGVWTAHAQPGATPAWVASTDPGLAQLLSLHYKCELREPEPDHVPSGAPDTGSEG